MQPFTLKSTKQINYDSKLKEYIIKNYDAESMTDKVKDFIAELQQNQNVISQMTGVVTNVDQIRTNKEIYLSYINQLEKLKGKMTFGKEEFSAKIEFTWTDTLKKSKFSSYNINFEFYNALFNYATLHFLLATFLAKEAGNEESILKEVTKNYRYAMGVYDIIKTEAAIKIPQKEMPIDLSSNFLDYLINLCNCYGQIKLYQIAEIKNSNFPLQSSLSQGISDLYTLCYKISCVQPLSKYGEEEFRQYLYNRAIYYNAMAYKKLKDDAMNKFKKEGEGYGLACSYQYALYKKLEECSANLKKCGNYIDQAKFLKFFDEQQKLGDEMVKKNTDVFHDSLKQDVLEVKLPSKNMITPLLPTDIMVGENVIKAQQEALKNPEAKTDGLEMLVPRQVKAMMSNYKDKIMQVITAHLDQCENETTINDFISQLNLPPKFTCDDLNDIPKEGNIEIPNELWNKISQCQQMGGTMGLSSTMQNIINHNDQMVGKLNSCLSSLANEEKDDMGNRNRFGNKWIRPPSSNFNKDMILQCQKLLSTLNQTKQFDQKENNDIIEKAKYFELISLPRETLTQKIPGRVVDVKKPVFSNDEQDLRDKIVDLKSDRQRCMNIINPIFEDLNNDGNIVNLFVNVLAKKSTEQAIFEKNKEDYEKKFTELDEITKEIKKKKDDILEMLPSVKNALNNNNNNNNVGGDAMNFFKSLDDYANEYLKKHEKLRKGSDYYNGIERNVNECCGGINNFLQKRFDEKNALIQSITGFSPNPPQNFNNNNNNNNNFNNFNNNNNNNDVNDFLNPAKNLYTNLNVKQFNYSEQQRLDKMKYANVKNNNNFPQNNFNNNNNNFPQNNFNNNNNNFPQNNFNNNNNFPQNNFNNNDNFPQNNFNPNPNN